MNSETSNANRIIKKSNNDLQRGKKNKIYRTASITNCYK